MRAGQMRRLLCSTGLSIAAATRSAGWTGANCASRCFHPGYGISPAGFRRRQTQTASLTTKPLG
jgi:transcriptional regulator GlxA family with amidase domain